MKILNSSGFFLLLLSVSCSFINSESDNPENNPSIPVQSIEGTPTQASHDIYAASDLGKLCVDEAKCSAPYEKIPAGFIRTTGQNPLDANVCNFDYDPNLNSSFVLHRVNGTVNGLKLLLSKEDLFFLAWVSMRQKINPHFLLGILSQESYGNCAAVSSSHGEGCFQITNTFGEAQLDKSHPARTTEWFWTDRNGSYYPDTIFIDPGTYFGELPKTDQFRITLDPTSSVINGTAISSVVNFHFGAIASGFYFYWQEYLLFHHYASLQQTATQLFQSEDGKALWQAAAYNGGAYGASLALKNKGMNFLEDRSAETQNYAPTVVDYCKSYEAGTLGYTATYTKDDVDWLIEMLAMTYPKNSSIKWNEVKDDVNQVFFSSNNATLTFVDDIKALVYVISTHSPELAPEWADTGSL